MAFLPLEVEPQAPMLDCMCPQSASEPTWASAFTHGDVHGRRDFWLLLAHLLTVLSKLPALFLVNQILSQTIERYIA